VSAASGNLLAISKTSNRLKSRGSFLLAHGLHQISSIGLARMNGDPEEKFQHQQLGTALSHCWACRRRNCNDLSALDVRCLTDVFSQI
jgi:hypothetical protein